MIELVLELALKRFLLELVLIDEFTQLGLRLITLLAEALHVSVHLRPHLLVLLFERRVSLLQLASLIHLLI